MHISPNMKRDLSYGGAAVALIVGGYLIVRFVHKPAAAVDDSSNDDTPDISIPQLSIPSGSSSISPVALDQIDPTLLAPPPVSTSGNIVSGCNVGGQTGAPNQAVNFYSSLSNPGITPAEIQTYNQPVEENPSIVDNSSPVSKIQQAVGINWNSTQGEPLGEVLGGSFGAGNAAFG